MTAHRDPLHLRRDHTGRVNRRRPSPWVAVRFLIVGAWIAVLYTIYRSHS